MGRHVSARVTRVRVLSCQCMHLMQRSSALPPLLLPKVRCDAHPHKLPVQAQPCSLCRLGVLSEKLHVEIVPLGACGFHIGDDERTLQSLLFRPLSPRCLPACLPDALGARMLPMCLFVGLLVCLMPTLP